MAEIFGGLGSMLGDIAGADAPFLSELEWTVQVEKNDDLSKKPDNWYDEMMSSVKSAISDAISGLAETVGGWFGFESTEKNWVNIASFESFISLNGVNDSQIVENAVERGSFRSVNKLNKPRTFVVELGQGGWKSKIEGILYNLEKYKGSTTLCRIVTPYGVIPDLNLKKLEYSFTRDNGSNLLIAKLTFQEILYNTELPDFRVETVKNPQSADSQNTGKKGLEAK